jgi:hypothetical protein
MAPAKRRDVPKKTSSTSTSALKASVVGPKLAKENIPSQAQSHLTSITKATTKSTTQAAKVNRPQPLQMLKTRTPSLHSANDTQLATLQARIAMQQGLSIYMYIYSHYLTHIEQQRSIS